MSAQYKRPIPVAKPNINMQQINNLNQKVHQQEIDLEEKKRLLRKMDLSPSKTVIREIEQKQKKLKQELEIYEVPLLASLEDIQNRKLICDSALTYLSMADTLNFINYIKRSVGANYPFAKYVYGLSILDGIGLKSNTIIGSYYINRASEAKCPEATCFIAELYESGDYGYKKDSVIALSYYEKSAEQGSFEGAVAAGDRYINNNDINRAIEFWKKAYNIKHHSLLLEKEKPVMAQIAFNLGYCCIQGYGMEKDSCEAVYWYKQAALQNHVVAINALPYLYYNANDNDSTILWGTRAECRDSADIQYLVGAAYYNKEDYKNAIEWWEKAASQNQPDALCDMGYHYLYGDIVSKDTSKAIEYYKRSAKTGYSEVYNDLGSIYYLKEYGVRNLQRAAYYWKEGAEAGNPECQYNYGCLLKKGKGVKKDKRQAIHWFTLSAQNGDKDAQAELKKMGIEYETSK